MAKQKKPLWEVMDDAGDPMINKRTLGPQTWGQIRAAELRALADEVVPEEPEPVLQWSFPTQAQEEEHNCEWAAWQTRMAIRQRLLDAAKEAESSQ